MRRGSPIEQFDLVVCCMWRQHLTAPWLIFLCPWSHRVPRGWTIYAPGPHLLEFVKCCRQFGHIFLVWYQLRRDQFQTLLMNWHRDGVPGVGASEGMAKEGAPIWHAREKCPILAQCFSEHRFFFKHKEQGCAELHNVYRCQPCAGG